MANIPSRHPDSAQCCGASIFLIEPAEVRYVYAPNFLGNTVSGLALSPSTGALPAVLNKPFKAAGQPTCSAAITRGNHSIEVIQP